MAQTQKETVKNNILQAASNHFVAVGINQASMRAIANDANVTVGNVYRYFPSKQKLAQAVLEEPLASLSQALTLQSSPDRYQPTTYEMTLALVNQQIEMLLETLLTLYQTHQQALVIVLNEETTYQQIQQWFKTLLDQIIEQWQLSDLHQQTTTQLTNMLATAILSGIKVAFNDALTYQTDQTQHRLILSTYLSLYSNMLLARNQPNEQN